MQHAIHPVIDGNLQAINQLEALLHELSSAQYCYRDSTLTDSSIGAHTRHILDIYHVLKCAVDTEQPVDYDTRRRGSTLEQQPQAALHELQALGAWLAALPTTALNQTMMIKSEVSLLDKSSVTVQSSLLRELVFVSSHCVHHLAIIAILARRQQLAIPAVLGVAPATASFLRNQTASAE